MNIEEQEKEWRKQIQEMKATMSELRRIGKDPFTVFQYLKEAEGRIPMVVNTGEEKEQKKIEEALREAKQELETIGKEPVIEVEKDVKKDFEEWNSKQTPIEIKKPEIKTNTEAKEE